jgi:hypothetical protein
VGLVKENSVDFHKFINILKKIANLKYVELRISLISDHPSRRKVRDGAHKLQNEVVILCCLA